MAEGNTFWGDAYKGDGMQGLGNFLKGIADAYRTVDQQTKELISHLSPEEKAQLQSFTQKAMSRYLSDEFSKDAASADITASYDGIFREYRESELPVIYGKLCSTGMYNSTAAQMLANDAYARAVDKAGQAKHGAIKDYAQLETARAEPALSAFNVALQDDTDRSVSYKEETEPNMEEFSKDAAVMFTIMGVLSIFSKRKYMADNTGSKTSTSTGVGGIVETVIDWFT